MATSTKNITKKALTQPKSARKMGEVPSKKGELVFTISEGLPKNTYGLSESAHSKLVSEIAKLQPNRNHATFPLSYRTIISKIIKHQHPDYVVRYLSNKDKEICSIWRTA